MPPGAAQSGPAPEPLVTMDADRATVEPPPVVVAWMPRRRWLPC